jgi:hypothetical protein
MRKEENSVIVKTNDVGDAFDACKQPTEPKTFIFDASEVLHPVVRWLGKTWRKGFGHYRRHALYHIWIPSETGAGMGIDFIEKSCVEQSQE